MLDNYLKEDIALFEGRSVDLLIESYSNAARILQVRGFCENAQILHDHTTNADRSLATSTVPVTGIPTTLTIRASATGVKRGACYVKVSLRVENVVVAILGAAYVTDTSSIQWPGGQIENSIDGPGLIRTITGTDPAAGAEISETVPVGARWKLRYMVFSFVCDATVISRLPTLVFDDGGNPVWRSTPATSPAAGDNSSYQVGGSAFAYTSGQSTRTFHIPIDSVLTAGQRIRTVTGSLQAGDNYSSPIYEVEEWIEP
jgi:hypothetical protein